MAISSDNTISTIEYECPYFKVLRKRVRMPTGKIIEQYVHTKTGAFVVSIGVSKDQVLVSKQWRPTIEAWNWEFPMGGLDEGEEIIEAAKREFLEETGYIGENWTIIGEFLVGAGHTDQKGIVCLCQNITLSQKPELEDAEVIEPELIKIIDFEKMIREGTIIDGPTLASWQIYQQKIVARAYESYGRNVKRK